jgi:NagD protein
MRSTFQYSRQPTLPRGVSHSEDCPEFVLVAFDRELTSAKLEKAARLLYRGIPFYQTHIDPYCPSLAGPIPDCGAITQLLISATGVKPLMHFGKPGAAMAAALRGKLDFQGLPLLVGDRLTTDIALGTLMGTATLLFMTGATTASELAASDQRPTYVASSFASFLRALI